jgi:membrane-bound metal-dependent hydrolase YbcI (DUF457 family)
MFIGHHAAAFAGKRASSRIGLGTLFAATMWLDLMWPFFTLAGLEHFRIDPGNTAFTPIDFYDYPWTHSMLMSLGWSIAFAVVYRLTKKPWRDAAIVGAAVFSHWVLDFVTHAPDLPLWPNGPKVGLGLWSSKPMTMAVEVLLFAICLVLYLRTTAARDRIGTIALWALVVFLGLIYITNLTSPPPPNWQAVAWTAIAQWLFVPWAWWIDRHRQARAHRQVLE